MIPYGQCKSAVVYFKVDMTIEIVQLEDTNFSEEMYHQIISSPKTAIEIKANYQGHTYSAVLIQLGASTEDLEITEDRCVSLLTRKRKRLNDLIIRIPRIHSGRRMIYEPLDNVFTSDNSSENEIVEKSPILKKKRNAYSHGMIQLPPINELPNSQAGVSSKSTLVLNSSTAESAELLSLPIPEKEPEFGITTHKSAEISELSKSKLTSFIVKKMNILVNTTNALFSEVKKISIQQEKVNEFILRLHNKKENSNEITKMLPLVSVDAVKDFVQEISDSQSFEFVVSA